MCRWLAYSGRPIYLEELVLEPEYSLISQSLRAREAKVPTNGDGFGVGWYGDRKHPGLYRDILPAWADSNLRSLAEQIRSSLFFAHVRASTGTATSRANCHPFVHGKWLFMHNGQIGGWERVRRRLENHIPDETYTHRHGTTDSEAFFLMLFGLGLEDDPRGALDRAVDLVENATREAGVAEPFRLTAAMTDGCRIHAVRWSSDPHPPTLYWSDSGRDDRGGHVMIVSEPLDQDMSHWREVPPGHVIEADCAGEIALHPFRF